jgi:7-carboxy-7-deazaguanine synthase
MDFAQIQKSLPKIEPNHNQTEESRPLVLVTGGEPLAQPAAFGLMQNLVDAGYKVLLETSGSEPIEKVPEPVHILLDLKCPDSKMSKHNLYENLEHLKKSDEIKFVVASKSDFDWAHALSTERGLYRKYHVLFSPAWGHVKEKDLSEWLLAINVPARLNLQQHKYIWGPRKKGV